MRFVDTNVLLYAVSTASDEASKAKAAATLLDTEDLALSVQVLQEFYVQATRAGKENPLSHDQAATLIECFLRFRVLRHERRLGNRRRFRISFWDAAIIEAARALGCAEVSR